MVIGLSPIVRFDRVGGAVYVWLESESPILTGFSESPTEAGSDFVVTEG